MISPKPYSVFLTCSECRERTEVEVTPYVPAYTSGRFEDCHPAEGGFIEPNTCACGQEFSYEEASRK
jgi:hypothetical protein